MATMRAVVFNGKYDVSVEDRPLPQIEDPRDLIVKVQYAGLCGTYVLLITHWVVLQQ